MTLMVIILLMYAFVTIQMISKYINQAELQGFIICPHLIPMKFFGLTVGEA